MDKKHYSAFIILFLISAFLFLSCIHNRKAINDYSLQLSVREGIGVSQAEVNDVFNKHIKSETGSKNILEVIIFTYSSGKETFFYSNDTGDNIKKKSTDGSIEALLKIKESGRLVDAVFLKAYGSSKDELIGKMAEEVKTAVED